VCGLFALLPLFASGHFAARNRDSGGRVTIRLAQGSANPPWESLEADDTFEALRSVTIRNAGRPDLVVWSESAIPYPMSAESSALRRTTDVASQLNAPLLTGAITYGPDGSPSNAAVLFAPDRRMAGAYRKRQLVPFGEFVPLRHVLPLLSDFGVVDRDEVAGGQYNVLSYGLLRIGVPICFESASPKASRAFVQKGANVLAIITNDAWFGRTGMAEQHLAEARLRAIETHRWVVRCAHTGISAFISPTGALVQRIPYGCCAAATAVVGLRTDQTPYVRWGNWFVAVCAAAALLALWSQMGIHTLRS
jgi:apolipoprotein N-acyltransferase